MASTQVAQEPEPVVSGVWSTPPRGAIRTAMRTFDVALILLLSLALGVGLVRVSPGFRDESASAVCRDLVRVRSDLADRMITEAEARDELAAMDELFDVPLQPDIREYTMIVGGHNRTIVTSRDGEPRLYRPDLRGSLSFYAERCSDVSVAGSR